VNKIEINKTNNSVYIPFVYRIASGPALMATAKVCCKAGVSGHEVRRLR